MSVEVMVALVGGGALILSTAITSLVTLVKASRAEQSVRPNGNGGVSHMLETVLCQLESLREQQSVQAAHILTMKSSLHTLDDRAKTHEYVIRRLPCVEDPDLYSPRNRRKDA